MQVQSFCFANLKGCLHEGRKIRPSTRKILEGKITCRWVNMQKFLSLWCLKPRANGRNIVGWYMLRPFAHPVACCWMLLCVVPQSLKPVKLFSQQLPIFLLFRDRRSVAQQCWIRLHSSSNIVGPRTLITHGLQRLMGCILHTMHCRSQQCWDLLRPFARSLSREGSRGNWKWRATKTKMQFGPFCSLYWRKQLPFSIIIAIFTSWYQNSQPFRPRLATKRPAAIVV